MFINFVFLFIGLFLISFNRITRFDRKKNSFTKESKFIWEKNYRVNKICKLTDIKSVEREESFFGQRISGHLLLKDGSCINPFPFPQNNRKNYDLELCYIEDFLANTDKKQNEFVLKKDSVYTFGGVCFTIVGIFGLYMHFFS